MLINNDSEYTALNQFVIDRAGLPEYIQMCMYINKELYDYEDRKAGVNEAV